MEYYYTFNSDTRYITHEELVHLEQIINWASDLTNPNVVVTNTDSISDIDAKRSEAIQELAHLNLRRQQLLETLLK